MKLSMLCARRAMEWASTVALIAALAILIGASEVLAERATENEARLVSENWLAYMVQQEATWGGSAQPGLLEGQTITHNDTIVGYYFPVEPTGYIVVPILKELPPVKAYSDEYRLDAAEAEGPAALLKEVLHRRIRLYERTYGSLDAVQPATGEVLLDRENRQEWAKFLRDPAQFKAGLLRDEMASLVTVGPLLTTAWHQEVPYNDLCPMGDGGRCVVGCVATAAAQIMKFWNWPPIGESSDAYLWDGDQSCFGNVGGGWQGANFEDEYYEWGDMLDDYTGAFSQDQADAVAELCREVGIAFHMDYGHCESGAWTYDALTVFPTYFRYDPATIDREDRDAHTPASWFSVIQAEINAGRPMQYRIYGHSIVCDGWRVSGGQNQYHINYGWGGPHTTWFAVDNIHNTADPLEEYLIRGIQPAAYTATPDFYLRDCSGDDGSDIPSTTPPGPCGRKFWAAEDAGIENMAAGPGAPRSHGYPFFGGWNRLTMRVFNRTPGSVGSARIFAYRQPGGSPLYWPGAPPSGSIERIVNDEEAFWQAITGTPHGTTTDYVEGDVIGEVSSREVQWYWLMPEWTGDWSVDHFCIGFVIHPHGGEPGGNPSGIDWQSDDHAKWDNNIAQINIQELIARAGKGGRATPFHTQIRAYNSTGTGGLFRLGVDSTDHPSRWQLHYSPSGDLWIDPDTFVLVDVNIEAPADAPQWDSSRVSFYITPYDDPDEVLGGVDVQCYIDNNRPAAPSNLDYLCTDDNPNCCPPWLIPVCGMMANYVPLEWDIPHADVEYEKERIRFFYVYRDIVPELRAASVYDSVAVDIDLDVPGFQYVDPDVDSCQTYYYAVAAVDGAYNVSEMSNVVEVSRCVTSCGPRPSIDPDPMYAYQAHAVLPIPGTAYLRPSVLPAGFMLADINVATLALNGSVVPTQVYLEGDEMNIDFDVRDFVQSYGAIWGTSDRLYTISGEFLDGTPFSFSCTVTLVGHRMADVNLDGEVNVADVVYLADYLFAGGDPPLVPGTADLNCDALVNIADLTFLVEYLFVGGPEPTFCQGAPAKRLEEKRGDISINSRYEDGVTVISLEAAVNVRGIQFDLVGEGGDEPVKLVDEKLELLSHQLDDMVRIGILDLNGSALITKGVTGLVRLPGRFEITEALVSDINHNVIVPTINAALKETNLPHQYSLDQNYPNPFNPTTEIQFALPVATDVKLEVFNIVGQKVVTLLEEFREAGRHSITWSGTNSRGDPVASGVYLYRLTAGDFVQTRKMMLLK